jgi:hypothetical protein
MDFIRPASILRYRSLFFVGSVSLLVTFSSCHVLSSPVMLYFMAYPTIKECEWIKRASPLVTYVHLHFSKINSFAKEQT